MTKHRCMSGEAETTVNVDTNLYSVLQRAQPVRATDQKCWSSKGSASERHVVYPVVLEFSCHAFLFATALNSAGVSVSCVSHSPEAMKFKAIGIAGPLVSLYFESIKGQTDGEILTRLQGFCPVARTVCMIKAPGSQSSFHSDQSEFCCWRGTPPRSPCDISKRVLFPKF